MRVTVLNGPNLNLVGTREPNVYGRTTLAEVEAATRAEATRLGITLAWYQSNHEGELVEWIQGLTHTADGLVLNAGAYTHTSMAVRDALLAVRVPFVEVHLSNVFAREPDRHRSLMADLAIGVIAGFGSLGYQSALAALRGHFDARSPG